MKESLAARYDRLYHKYCHVGCPAAQYDDNCAHPDRCAENGRCLDLAPLPTEEEVSDGSKVQEK